MSKAIQEMFAGIAHRYDATNDVLSLGLHRLWRKFMVSATPLCDSCNVLDVCCGTGDLTMEWLRHSQPDSLIFGVDFALPMLEIARSKATAINLAQPPLYIHGDALALPFADNSFDVVSSAFGVRNLDSLNRFTTETQRVLKPGGYLVILEFGQVKWPILAPLFRFYSKFAMPLIGQLMTGNRKAYEYLPKTSSIFPCDQIFAGYLGDAGFLQVRVKSFAGGIAYGYWARKAG